MALIEGIPAPLTPAAATKVLVLRNYVVYKDAWKLFITGFLEPVFYLFSIGVGVGALVRNQIAAVVAALAWTFVVEQLLVALWPEVGRWTPGGAASAVLQLGDLATTRGDLLPVWGGALLLVAYAVVLSVVGARVTLERDLT